MQKHEKEYKQIDDVFDKLNKEFEANITVSKPQKKSQNSEISQKINREKSAIQAPNTLI